MTSFTVPTRHLVDNEIYKDEIGHIACMRDIRNA
jgi:hypothetical protein